MARSRATLSPSAPDVGHSYLHTDPDETSDALQLHEACTKLFRVILRWTRDDPKVFAPTYATIHRSSSSLVLWGRDVGVTGKQLDAKIAQSQRLRRKVVDILSGICRMLLHRILPIVTSLVGTKADCEVARNNALGVLEALEPICDEDDADTSSSIDVRSSSLDETVADLYSEIECLMDISLLQEDRPHKPDRSTSTTSDRMDFNKVQPALECTSTVLVSPNTGISRTKSSLDAAIALVNNEPVSLKRAMDESKESGGQPNLRAFCDNTHKSSADGSLSMISLASSLTEYNDAHGSIRKPNLSWISLDSSLLHKGLPHVHSSFSFYFPRAENELAFSDIKYAMLREVHHEMVLAPIGEHPKKILDLGTGTGTWAIDVADRFPESEVQGWDLNPIQPKWVPPNLTFLLDDMELDWMEDKESFDYIHSSETVYTIKDWDKFLSQSLEHLRPGGWLELKYLDLVPESHSIMPSDQVSTLSSYWLEVEQGLLGLGINTMISCKGRIADMLRTTGFTHVTEKMFQVPIGPWSKDSQLKFIGMLFTEFFTQSCASLATIPLRKGQGWEEGKVEKFIAQTLQDY